MLPEHHAFVMELADGKTVTALCRETNRRAEAFGACELAGQALARLHLAWKPAIAPVLVDHLAHDLEGMPGGLSSWQHDVLHRALNVVADSTTAVGLLYLDFKADNVLCAGNTLSFLDPPQARRIGMLRWDTATFGASLRWQLWKGAIRPRRRERSWCFQECLARFELGCRRQAPDLANQSPTEPILMRLLELQQVGQLLAYQTGKLRLTWRKRNPLAFNGGYARELATTVAWLPVLQLRKRWLFQRLAQELATATPANGRLTAHDQLLTNALIGNPALETAQESWQH
jgi:hypothetical protein